MSLEELNLHKTNMTEVELARLTSVLSYGACPELRILNLSYNRFGPEVVVENFEDPDEAAERRAGGLVASMLRFGFCRKLQHLGLVWSELCRGEFEIIARALENGACPDLRSLDMSAALTVEEVEALASTIRSGALQPLEGLRLYYGGVTEYDELDCVTPLVPVLRALRAGGCPNLKVLGMNYWMREDDALLLAQLLSSGWLKCTRELSFWTDHSHACQRILEAIRDGACPDLHQFYIFNTEIESDHSRLLREVFRAGAFAHLELLDLVQCPLLDEGITKISEGLSSGPHSITSLILNNVNMGPAGARALAQALSNPGMSQLRELDIGGQDLGTGVTDVVKAVGANCGGLTKLVVQVGVETCEAITEALGCWPYLKVLHLSGKPSQFFGASLAGVLDGGGGAMLVELCLDLKVVGSPPPSASHFALGGGTVGGVGCGGGNGLVEAVSEGFNRVAAALLRGVCPSLRHLTFPYMAVEVSNLRALSSKRRNLDLKAGKCSGPDCLSSRLLRETRYHSLR